MSYLIRRVLANPRLILDEMCRLYGKFASYLLRRVLCKTRLIFPRINGPIVPGRKEKRTTFPSTTTESRETATGNHEWRFEKVVFP